MAWTGHLEQGATIRTHPARRACRIEQLIGAGGQGEVYAASIDGMPAAVKWYGENSFTAMRWQWENLAMLVERGAPDGRFLWPLALVSRSGDAPVADGEEFGYVMPLRERRFHGLAEVLQRLVRPELTQLVIAGFQLADSYRQLHSRGWAYRDISEGNAFLDPSSGNVAICDNDNVSIDGEPALIGGTPRYMAPEILRRQAVPSRQTDLWSLAVLLFHLLINNHPLEGALAHDIHCFDSVAHRLLFAHQPVFVFHPGDPSNRPVAGTQDAPLRLWGIYPEPVRELFTRTFVDGVDNPSERAQEAEWQAVLAGLRDQIVRCPGCRKENFYDLDGGGRPGACFRCATALVAPPRIVLSTAARSSLVMLEPSTRLYPHHFGRRYDYGSAAAEVVEHPRRPGAFGLRNLSDRPWSYVGGDGRTRTAEPGQAMPLVDHVTVSFGRVEGHVHV